MQFVIPFPGIGNEIFSIDIGGFDFALRWYALAYIVGIIIGYRIVLRAVRTPRLWRDETPPTTPELLEAFLTWAILGIILGGRLGFVLFYQPAYYLQNPAEILQVWNGGMSFHGGFLGVVIAGLIFCKKHGIKMLSFGDLMAMAAPVGLLLGRLANFNSAELWGRPSTLPWAVIFPGIAAQNCPDVIGACARHPSQLYEAAMEGLILGAVVLFLAWRRDWLKKPGQLMGLFIAGYGVSRFIVEFFRQADAQFITATNPMGYVMQFGDFGLTKGQQLSLPMIAIGLIFILLARKRT
ncbi:prolipoprotein diacylglyceryl transferase [Profundibacter amoris]|uniref:Phosphatidylglycerol--prolipoprotein diacylglyceryl transferase n=1 Tax=Profundibacter amoris TaxID=2171755 RepID=A0A347UJ13_9RHOB|nr:prolipoprotein diacylglyceryl transferase [Profundibacter amoris]AXX98841.1 prolipoprotein diacylglyceryl transferase [Profundibacter amoris]